MPLNRAQRPRRSFCSQRHSRSYTVYVCRLCVALAVARPLTRDVTLGPAEAGPNREWWLDLKLRVAGFASNPASTFGFTTIQFDISTDRRGIRIARR